MKMNLQSTTHSAPSTQRFIVFDLLRLISVLVIVPFHLSEFSFDNESQQAFANAPLNSWLIKIAKVIPFSGHTVILLSFFLLGYGLLNTRKVTKLLWLCFIGYFVLLFSYYEPPYPLLYWDIYSFLTVSLVLSFVFLQTPYGLTTSFLLGIAFSLFDVSNLKIEALGGICTSELKTSWPLLPWGFYAAYFACLGQQVRLGHNFLIQESQKILQKKAVLIFLFFAGCFYFILDNITNAPATSGMYCFIQSLNSIQKIFLLLTWTVIFLYGSGKSAKLTKKLNLFQKLQKISWNKNFALAYFIQIILIGTITSVPNISLTSSVRYDLSLITIFIGTEAICQIIFKYSDRTSKNGVKV